MSNVRSATYLSPEVLASLQLLVENWRLAEKLKREPLQFAMTLAELTAVGCTEHALAGLIQLGYAEQRVAISGREERRVKKRKSLREEKAFCVTLTQAGFDYAVQTGMFEGSEKEKDNHCLARPRYADFLLSVGLFVVKRYLQKANVQQLILTAFEEDGWPEEIDDPLPPLPSCKSKLRLRLATQNLNRHQRVCLLQFYGSGTGEKIGWRFRR